MTEDSASFVASLAESIVEADPDTRWLVAAKLSEVPGPESEKVLISLLGDPDYRVREKAVAVLTRRFTREVAKACLSGMGDEENAGRRGASVSLLSKGGVLGTETLVEALASNSPDVRLAAALALPAEGAGPNAVLALERALLSEVDANVRAGILLALGRTKRREAIRPLLMALEQSGPWHQIHALEALGEIGDPGVASRLLPLLDIPALRRATLRTLARLESPGPSEDLAFRAARGETDSELIGALRHCLSAAPASTCGRVREIWTAAPAVLSELLGSTLTSPEQKSDAAHLLALLDVESAAFLIVRAGRTADGYGALNDLPVERLNDVMSAALQEEDPEPAFALVDRLKGTGNEGALSPLLVHPSPLVQATVLSLLPAGAAPLGEVMQILAEEDPETVLPAALALSAVHPQMPLDRVKRQHQALLDRARGADGPGRSAAVTALASVPGADVDEIIRHAVGSLDPAVRAAAAGAIGMRDSFSADEILKLADDPESRVRAALLRSLARLGERKPAGFEADWRDVLIYLADDSPVAAAAGEALMSLAGPERSRLAEEMLAQGDSIRRAAIEEIVRTGDSEAAASVAIAVDHEDLDTARAVLRALEIAPQPVAEDAAAQALADPRPEVREAAAELLARRGQPPARPSISDALARTMVEEREPLVLKALLKALVVAGGESALEPLTAILARERVEKEAIDAATALARRHEREVKRLWVSAPARAERRWAAALAAAAKSRQEERGAPS